MDDTDEGDDHEKRCYSALFLGPQSENREYFKKMIDFAVDEHIHWRRNFNLSDRPIVTRSEQRERSYEETLEETTQTLATLSTKLKKSSMPWFSPRYIGHMVHDPTMVASLAHITAVLYNPNNVAREAAPATTRLEVEVGDQLAELFGYESENTGVNPWGHLTSGGTVANYEALWIAKTLRSAPLAIKRVEERSSSKFKWMGNEYTPRVKEQEPWELYNFSMGETLELLDDVLDQADDQNDQREFLKEIQRHSVRGLGTGQAPMGLETPGKLLVPRSRHYSWDKAVDVLGIGTENLVKIPVDDSYRMDISALERTVKDLTGGRDPVPILGVVAVLGTTEHGAVDKIHEIIEFRDKCKEEGVWFYLHLDAAYGGYFRSLFVDEEKGFLSVEQRERLNRNLHQRGIVDEGTGWPTKSVHRAYEATARAESITVDPHKTGYVPYPAGAFVLKDRRVLDLIAHEAPYVHRREVREDQKNPPFLGSTILEGSKTGASAAAVWAAHDVIGLTMDGYGLILGRGITAARRLYDEICEKSPFPVGGQEYLIEPVVEPDLNVIEFAVNRVDNSDLEEMNRINAELYRRLTEDENIPVPTQAFLTSHTELTQAKYRDVPRAFAERCGISALEWEENSSMFVLRSCIMSPYLLEGTVGEQSEDTDGDPIARYFAEFTDYISAALADISE